MMACMAVLHSCTERTDTQTGPLALPENVMEHFKKRDGHSGVYVFDRGQSSTEAFAGMQSDRGLRFAGRPVENRKLSAVKASGLTFKKFSYGALKQDAIVQRI